MPHRLADWLERERREPIEAGTDLPDVRRPLVSRRGGERVVARLVPAANPDGDVLLLHRPDPDTRTERLESLGLTDREAEILTLVARGLTNADIGAELYVEPSTVKTHLENTYRKLGVRSRAAAVAVAVDLLSE